MRRPAPQASMRHAVTSEQVPQGLSLYVVCLFALLAVTPSLGFQGTLPCGDHPSHVPTCVLHAWARQLHSGAIHG